MVVKKDVCIVGLGWLGQALYHHLEEAGFAVIGTRTTQYAVDKMRERGMNAYLLKLAPEQENDEWKNWFNCRILVINIPPGRRDSEVEERYPKLLNVLLQMATESGVERIIFVSSTSVFGAARGVVDDDSPVRPNTASGQALVVCERMLREKWDGEYATVRFGGLYGPNRHPGRFFAGRKDAPDGDAPVNFIHRKDCIGVILFLMEHPTVGVELNACAPAHPPKKIFYHRAALDAGYEPPQFLPGGSGDKEVRCSWLKREGFAFKLEELELRSDI